MHNPAAQTGYAPVIIPQAPVWMDIGLQTGVGLPVRSSHGLFP
jgi:hypothetical protein